MLNNINFLGLNKNLNSTNKTDKKSQTNSINNFSLNFKGINPNRLAPLNHDTINFTAIRGGYSKDLFNQINNIEECQELSTQAKPYEEKLSNFLNTSLRHCICDDKNTSKPIRRIESRTKSPISIKEKSIDIYGEIKNKEIKDDFNPSDIEHLKKKIGDVVGARIVLTQPKPEYIKKIVDKLIEGVNSGEIEITSIKNCIPEDADENARKYTKTESIVPLALAQVKKGKDVIIRNGANKSGYMGLHIGLEFKDSAKKGEAPIKGEIQIVDEYIAQLKEVEDFCYKIRGGKSIKAGDPAYEPFSSYFDKYYDTKKYPTIKTDWLEYTKKAYEIQRSKSIGTTKAPTNSLPTREQCNMQNKIPKELDFNQLATVKLACDILYKQIHSKEE